eukprot:TRINITY_DN3444_c0_g1_i1.p1 TRINITY_DN3444_c0_g1~~TRINITY_DN3444_c0_g1_i1.p1  ORF type:complete len:548 (+),score=15.57 TRINITY_DN3444_c0_g1_i1:47-1645(+)
MKRFAMLLCLALVPLLGTGLQMQSNMSTFEGEQFVDDLIETSPAGNSHNKHVEGGGGDYVSAGDARAPSREAAVSKPLPLEMVRATTESSGEGVVITGQTLAARAIDEHSDNEGNVLDVGDELHYEAYTIHCRAHHLPTGTWGHCPVPEGQIGKMFWQTARILNSSRRERVFHSQKQASQGTLTKMLPQVCVDAASNGTWETSSSDLPRDSLGSHSRYAGKVFYLGPLSALREVDQSVFALPHATTNTEAARPLELESTPEFFWTPDLTGTGCPKYDWMRQGEAHSCLAGTWIAVWGDSTSRILFSALLDFLAGGIESEALPTHDFTYDRHKDLHDRCVGELQCHLAVHIPNHNILLTFNFVTDIASWPDLMETLAYYADNSSFPDIAWPRSRPDVVLANNGPWEYHKEQSAQWSKLNSETKNVYASLLSTFLSKNFQPGSPTQLLLLRNTACPIGTCGASKMSCVEAMDDINDIQSQVVRTFDSAQVRYIGGSYSKLMPKGYQCEARNTVHLPSVITDMRLNHALHTLCRA